MEPMKRLLSIGLLVLVAACNASQMNQTAPEIVGESWIRANGDNTPVSLDQRWTLVEFFAPT